MLIVTFFPPPSPDFPMGTIIVIEPKELYVGGGVSMRNSPKLSLDSLTSSDTDWLEGM